MNNTKIKDNIFNDYIICIFTDEHKNLLNNIKNKYNMNSVLLIDDINNLLKVKHIDILIICDDKISEYTPKIRDVFNDIKILAVIDKNPILSMKLISKGIDGIIKKSNIDCNRWISSMYKQIKNFIKVYKSDKQIKIQKERRISENINFYNGNRKTDNLMRYAHA